MFDPSRGRTNLNLLKAINLPSRWDEILLKIVITAQAGIQPSDGHVKQSHPSTARAGFKPAPTKNFLGRAALKAARTSNILATVIPAKAGISLQTLPKSRNTFKNIRHNATYVF
jgi:hypothetical protein